MYNTHDSTAHCDLELQLSSNKQTYSRVHNLLALLTVVKKTSKEIENVQSPFPGDDMKALETAVSAAIAVKSWDSEVSPLRPIHSKNLTKLAVLFAVRNGKK